MDMRAGFVGRLERSAGPRVNPRFSILDGPHATPQIALPAQPCDSVGTRLPHKPSPALSFHSCRGGVTRNIGRSRLSGPCTV